MNLTIMDVYRMMANAVNSILGSPGDVFIERTIDQKCRVIISDIPIYPTGEPGYLAFDFPMNFAKLAENNDIVLRELSQYEIHIFNGKTPTTKVPLIHTNIFDDGHPCLGTGSGAVRIQNFFDLPAYVVASVLRINMTYQSFQSPTTRRYGSTPEEMNKFKERVRNMLRRHFGDDVVNLDYSQIYDGIREYFLDQYKIYTR